MATPNADRLHGIEEWRTSSIEHALDLFSSVTEELAEVADINREVSSDLGLEGGTADAACRILRTIAADMDENADSLTQIVNVSRDALQAGIQAKYESAQIQSDLTKINNTLLNKFDNGTSAQSTPELAAYYQAQLDAAHAEIEKRATKTLTTLNGRALTAIGGLPFQDQIRAMLGRDNPGLAQRLRQHMEFGRTAPADNGRPPTPPTRSATDWRVSPDRSLGSPGSHTGHTRHKRRGRFCRGCVVAGGALLSGSFGCGCPGLSDASRRPDRRNRARSAPRAGLGRRGCPWGGCGRVQGLPGRTRRPGGRSPGFPGRVAAVGGGDPLDSAGFGVDPARDEHRPHPGLPDRLDRSARGWAGRGDRGRPARLLLVVFGVGEVVTWGDDGPAGRRAENTVSRVRDAQRRGHRPAQAHGLDRAGRKTRPGPNRTRRLTHNRNQFARSLVDPRSRIQDRKRLPRGRIDRDNRKHTRDRVKREDGGPRDHRLDRAKRFDEAGRGGAQRGLLAGRPPPDRQSLPAGSGRFDLAGPALPRTPNPRCGQKETRPGRRDGRDGLRDRQHRHLPRRRTPHHPRRRRHCTLNPSTNDAGVGTPHSAPTPTFTLERVPSVVAATAPRADPRHTPSKAS